MKNDTFDLKNKYYIELKFDLITIPQLLQY
jgi:hypothetical protein